MKGQRTLLFIESIADTYVHHHQSIGRYICFASDRIITTMHVAYMVPCLMDEAMEVENMASL